MPEDLAPPERVHYFFGQLLGEDDFTAEQEYFIGSDRRTRRCLHGWGVVCGLGVDASTGGAVIVQPGLAIDPLGREIVVPEPRTVHPEILTDETGSPSGDAPSEDAVTICLAYAETLAAPIPGPEESESRYGRTIETYSLVVRDGLPSVPPRLLSREQAALLLSGAGSPAERLATGSPDATTCRAPSDPCVVIATVRSEAAGLSVDPWTHRKQLYRVDILQELIFRLARRVSELEAR